MGKYKKTPRYNVISMRVSDREQKIIQKLAFANSLSISEMMRCVVERFTVVQKGTNH